MYTLWKKNEKFNPKNNNSRDEEQATSSPLTPQDKKIVPTKVALNKVINSVDESQFDSSPCLQS